MWTHRHAAVRGFTILEVLIALVVMAFGILAVAGMQLMLSRNSDVAKQRSEATRLAQERMERLRAFDGIGSGTIDWNNLPVAAETFNANTNATFKVTAALGGTTADAMRSAAVTVRWLDRAANASDTSADADGFSYNQQVVLSSVISKTDPERVGFVMNPLPLNQPLKRVKNRNINIPIPAIDLGDNSQSATQFSNTVAIVYSDTTGNVIRWCTLPNIAMDAATATDINNAITNSQCQSITGYIVAGYISRSGTSGTTGISDTLFNALGVNLSGVTRNTPGTQPIACIFRNAADQNNTSSTIPNYKYYLCVIPLSTPFTWSGTIRVSGVSTNDDYLICRYQYTQTNLDSNERNVQPYTSVGQSIDEQNYVITRSNGGNCPSVMTVSGVSSGVVHQDCRTAQATSTNCPTSAYP